MAGDDYSSAIRGGLKLKGSKPAGVKKKKKSKPSVPSSETAQSALQVAASSKSDNRTEEEKEADKKLLVEKKGELKSKLSMLEDSIVDTKGKGKYQREPEPEVEAEIKQIRLQLDKLEGLIVAASDPTVAKVIIEDEEEEERGYKTPAQIRQEEMKRKRLEEKFEKEGGVKTHKERVEELNRYLSGLSEHHDMPKIGPG